MLILRLRKIIYISACLILVFPVCSLALKMQLHPIEDLIEGDERTPPEGEHIIEERAATPAYPLPNMSRFPQENAIETFPQMSKQEVSKEAASEFEDEWAEWSSWDEWSDADGWDSWDKTNAGEKPPADSSNADAEKSNWDSWVSGGKKT